MAVEQIAEVRAYAGSVGDTTDFLLFGEQIYITLPPGVSNVHITTTCSSSTAYLSTGPSASTRYETRGLSEGEGRRSFFIQGVAAEEGQNKYLSIRGYSAGECAVVVTTFPL